MPSHFFLLFLFLLSFTNASSPHKKKLREKHTHLHFYFHDILTAPNATAVQVIPPSADHPSTFFGSVTIIDDPLTEGPERNSRPVGRAQGLYAGTSQEELGLLMTMNLAFTTGKYNGSVLSVLGRNQPLHPVREMPIVGGSGLFRFARGYALAQTHLLNFTTGDAIVEYNVHVMHY